MRTTTAEATTDFNRSQCARACVSYQLSCWACCICSSEYVPAIPQRVYQSVNTMLGIPTRLRQQSRLQLVANWSHFLRAIRGQRHRSLVRSLLATKLYVFLQRAECFELGLVTEAEQMTDSYATTAEYQSLNSVCPLPSRMCPSHHPLRAYL